MQRLTYPLHIVARPLPNRMYSIGKSNAAKRAWKNIVGGKV
jgi:hypothetical protein